MKKTLSFITVLLSVILVLTSCGTSDLVKSKAYADGEMYDYVTQESDSNAGNSKAESYFGFADDMDMTITEPEALYNRSLTTGNYINSVLEQRKIIYSSNFRIQTTEFESAVSALEELCKKYGAYYESANNYGTAEKANRNGSYTVRVPVQNYQAFRAEAGNIGTVIMSSENNKDVTENYFDTEARLTSAKLREERLLEILKTADNLDDILLLEAELADVRYEIESMSGTLRKYDSLISYSTISIEIEEVIKPVEIKATPRTFSDRMSQAAANGFEDFSDTLQDVAVELSYNLPSIIIFAVFVIIIVIVIKTAVSKSRKTNKNGSIENKTEEKK